VATLTKQPVNGCNSATASSPFSLRTSELLTRGTLQFNRSLPSYCLTIAGKLFRRTHSASLDVKTTMHVFSISI